MCTVVKIRGCSLYIEKEAGRTYVRNTDGQHKPIEYAVYLSERMPVGLRDYMNIKGLSAKEALNELEECSAYLMGPMFQICFFTESDSKKFAELIAQ